MGNASVPLWVTLVGFAVPLLGLAGSAIAYVVRLYRQAAERRHQRLFELLAHIDGQGTIATKVGAVYALRDFPEHADFIARFCDDAKVHVTGDASILLSSELAKTAEYMRSL